MPKGLGSRACSLLCSNDGSFADTVSDNDGAKSFFWYNDAENAATDTACDIQYTKSSLLCIYVHQDRIGLRECQERVKIEEGDRERVIQSEI